jgi:Protein of unknown function (DUF1761)
MQGSIVIWAIFAAAIASYAFGAIYYMALGKHWLKALGKTGDEVQKNSTWGPAWAPFVIAFLGQLIMALIFANLLAHFAEGKVSIGAAVATAVFIWVAFIYVPIITNHAYGGSKPSLTVIDSLHWLGVVIIQGIVLALIGVTPVAA